MDAVKRQRENLRHVGMFSQGKQLEIQGGGGREGRGEALMGLSWNVQRHIAVL